MNELENSKISGDRVVDFFVMHPKEKFLLNWSNRQEGNNCHTVKNFIMKYKAINFCLKRKHL